MKITIPHVLQQKQNGYKALTSFGLDSPQQGDFGVQIKGGVEWLAKGDELLMPVSEVKQAGRHNLANSLAALALGDAVGLKCQRCWRY